MQARPDNFEERAWRFGCGTLVGLVAGVFFAPSLQRGLRVVGIDPYATGPGIALVLAIALAMGFAFARKR